MSRTTRVTITASAVTLLCLGASLSASPQVIAETLGREVHTFSPLDPSTYPGRAEQEPPRALDASTAPRQQSTMSPDGTWMPKQPTEDADATAPGAQPPVFGIAGAEASAQPPQTPSTQADSHEPAAPQTSDVASAPENVDEDAGLDPTDQDDTETGQPAEEDDPVVPDVDTPESVTVIVNKLRPLPEDFVPEDLVELPAEFSQDTVELREEAAEATEKLFAAAHEDGIDLTVISAYRSFEYQQELYEGYTAQHGTDRTNEMSARPGHSEHQTGLAIDVDTPDGAHTLQQSFGETQAGQWLAEHADTYGFVIRYPQGAHEVTGFQYEPWHLRYFGEDYAQQIMEGSGVAETEFDLDPAPDYAP
ncbi:hypothetical protein GCM10023190_10150 [Enteractinococcus fodinae]|uniref:D-alanyl-D-alanine carboxypeptidase n=1 Tax=Enteractinococcus fodinae TaxID=684663 RepID=A0ABU2B2B7_9MICC|nr:D-alanyl-D-alanine carboxypeptidase family protein [Enteractinococcus fodinae]MDR7346509.1 D-alanyl-D-alanine carboxypeptidase [Enteractinococcus fodinae]